MRALDEGLEMASRGVDGRGPRTELRLPLGQKHQPFIGLSAKELLGQQKTRQDDEGPRERARDVRGAIATPQWAISLVKADSLRQL